MKRFSVNIWFLEKWRSYPRVRYYEAEREKDVTTGSKRVSQPHGAFTHGCTGSSARTVEYLTLRGRGISVVESDY